MDRMDRKHVSDVAEVVKKKILLEGVPGFGNQLPIIAAGIIAKSDGDWGVMVTLTLEPTPTSDALVQPRTLEDALPREVDGVSVDYAFSGEGETP